MPNGDGGVELGRTSSIRQRYRGMGSRTNQPSGAWVIAEPERRSPAKGPFTQLSLDRSAGSSTVGSSAGPGASRPPGVAPSPREGGAVRRTSTLVRFGSFGMAAAGADGFSSGEAR